MRPLASDEVAIVQSLLLEKLSEKKKRFNISRTKARDAKKVDSM